MLWCTVKKRRLAVVLFRVGRIRRVAFFSRRGCVLFLAQEVAVGLFAGFHVVVLVVVLSFVEGLCGLDACGDRLLVLGSAGGFDFFGGELLSIVVIEDHGAILITNVWALAIDLRWIVEAKENIDERIEAHLGGVVGDLHDFNVTCIASADLLVGWVFEVATCVATHGIEHTWYILEDVFDTPEATSAEGGEGFGRSGGQSRSGCCLRHGG